MRDRIARLSGIVLVATALVVVAAVFAVLNEGGPRHGATSSWNGWTEVAVWMAYMLSALAVGILVMARHRGNRTGPVAAYGALAGVVALAGDQVAGYALVTRPGTMPGGLAARLVSHLGFVTCWALLGVVLPAVFPNGRVLSRWWRPFIWLGVAGCAAFGLLVFQSDAFSDDGLLGDLPDMRNPVAPQAIRGMVVAVSGFGIFAIFAGMLAAVVSLLVRAFQRPARERAQVRVVAFATAIALFGGLALANLMNVLEPGSLPHSIASVGASVVGVLVPVSLGVAIVRRRVYDIDRLINRTIVYVVVSGALAASYMLVVFLVGTAVPGGDRSDLAVAVGTLAVAALFRPVRSRIQGFIDRRFNRSRYDAARIIESFGATLRQDIDIETLRAELLDTVARTMQPVSASLWVASREA